MIASFDYLPDSLVSVMFHNDRRNDPIGLRMATASESLAANLAQEILHAILEFVKDDRDTLKACGRVNQAWTHASRVLLFHSVDLSSTLARNDWLSFFLKAPFGVGDLVRQIIVKNAKRGTEFTPTGVRVLTHFAASVTSLVLSDVHVTDFANLVSTVSKFKELRSLFLKRVSWDTNTIDYNQPLPPHQTFPIFVAHLRLIEVNLDPFLGWLLAHPRTPIPSSLFIGPMDHHSRFNTAQYLQQVFPSMTDLGFFFPDAKLDPYSPSNCFSTADHGTSQQPTHPFFVTLHESLKAVTDRFQTRHGFFACPLRLDLNGIRLRTFRIHKFISHCSVEDGHVCKTLWFARLLLTIRDFRGTVVFEVDVPTVGMVDGLKMDWDFLDDLFSTEVYKELEAVVFLATSTTINLTGLENLLSLRLPKTYGRKSLRVERGEDICA